VTADIQANQETLQSNQSRLMVAVNRLQSEKLGDVVTSAAAPHHGKATAADNTNTITHAAKHNHKLLFLTHDGAEDPLPCQGAHSWSGKGHWL
jgi:pantothenate kinase